MAASTRVSTLVSTVGTAGTAGAGLLTAESFTSAVLAAGGSELVGFFLAHDASQFRTLGTGVASWLDQTATGAHATQAVGSQQPSMVVGGASNGRDAIRLENSASQYLLSALGAYTTATGERWALLLIGRWHTALGGSWEWGMTLANYWGSLLYVDREPGSTQQGGIFYENGATDVWEHIVSSTDNDLLPFASGVLATSPHSVYWRGTTTAGAQTPGLASDRAGASTVGFGTSTGTPTQPDLDLWCACVFKMSGTAQPSGWDAILAAAREYYEEPTL
jgi:hypothetical protein